MMQARQAPTQSVVLPYEKTLGPEAVEIYNATEHDALEWQVMLIYDIMAVNDDGLWTHQKFGYSVPRRNGKSENAIMRCAWGLLNGEKILYTAHRATTSHSVWERLARFCEKADINVVSKFRAFGKEHIYTDNGIIEFRTRTSSGGLGEGYDLLIIDEAQEYTPDQETTLKYVVSDSLNPQTIMLGTPPTAVSAGTVFPKFRKTVLSGGGFESGWAEWSVAEATDPHNVEAWYETNPSLGTILTERKIRSEIGENDTDFNIQRLGLWLKYNVQSAISRNEWEALAVKKLPSLKGKLFVGIKYGRGGTVAMSIAVKTTDGKVFVECIDCQSARNGTDWMVSFIQKADVRTVVVDGASGQGILSDAMKNARLKAPILPRVSEIIRANALFEQGLSSGNIVHKNQPSLTQSVSNCEKRAIGSNGGFGYRSLRDDIDIALLDSVILAYWPCVEAKEVKQQRISY